MTSLIEIKNGNYNCNRAYFDMILLDQWNITAATDQNHSFEFLIQIVLHILDSMKLKGLSINYPCFHEKSLSEIRQNFSANLSVNAKGFYKKIQFFSEEGIFTFFPTFQNPSKIVVVTSWSKKSRRKLFPIKNTQFPSHSIRTLFS